MTFKDLYKKRIVESVSKNVLNELLNEEKCNNNIDVLIENVIKHNLEILNEKKKENSNKKRSVIQWLKKPEIDAAEIRRKLEGEPESQEEEDSKRSYFMKKVNQSYGKDFTDKEVNDLYAIKSNLGQ